MNNREITQPIAEAITVTFDAPVDEVLTANLDSNDTVFGQLMSGGNFYSYVADTDKITTYYHPEETEYLNEYAHATLDSIGIHTDTWETYDYALGFFRVDAQMRCKPGNKPCGKRCIPQQMKCKSSMSGSAQAKMRQGRVNLRSPGGVGSIAADVAGAAVLATGIAAYQNREAIGKGVEVAKQKIQEAANNTGKAAQRAGKKAVIAVKRVQKGAENIVKGVQQQTTKSQKRLERFKNEEYRKKTAKRLGTQIARKEVKKAIKESLAK
jgi:hypothetical protein